MTSEAVLLAMQAPNGMPRSRNFDTVSDPMLPPGTTKEMLAHFPEEIYDTSAESHLSRLMKVLLGDAGVGQLRKRYTYAHLSQFVLTSRYNDLDRLYASIFGLGRFLRERLSFDPYLEAATDAEWEALDAADAEYRNRVESFSRSIPWAGTPTGMAMAASAILGEECRVYESYEFVDNQKVYADETTATTNTWGDLEGTTWGEKDGQTYASLEGNNIFRGRDPSSRGEFIVRPLRDVTAEERYHLIKVLSRLKPAEALMTVDSRPGALYTPVATHRAAASSSYWHIQTRVQVPEDKTDLYSRSNPGTPEVAVEQPRLAFSQYQGEAFAYNGDVTTVEAYVEDENENLIQSQNYERDVDDDGNIEDHHPEKAMQPVDDILRGRAVSDGILISPVASRG